MPTVRGWALLGAGLVLVLLWYILGDPELLLTAVFFLVATIVALGYVRFHPPNLSIARRLGSAVVHNGDATSVTLVISNPTGKPVGRLSIVDEVHRLGRATFEVAAVRAGEAATASYRVVCRPRGVYHVGPTVSTASDPLGLAELRAPGSAVDRIVVYPTAEAFEGFPIVAGRDMAMQASVPEHNQRGGEDFYTLREYQRGDDLRRVHWPYSAKTEELMIRQLETPWQSRALVILDVRPDVYESSEAFETAVSGAASVVTHLVSSGFDADLWAGDAEALDATNYSGAMESLAAVQPNHAIDMHSVAMRLRQSTGGGALVLVSGIADRSLLNLQQLLSREYRTTVLMAATSSTPQTIVGFHRVGATTVEVPPGGEWAPEWNSAVRNSWDAVSAS